MKEIVESEQPNIWVAASDGNIELVAQYVSNGTDVNAQDEYGYSPIHAACSYGHVELLRWLIEQGGQIDLKDAEGDTPLHGCEDVECATILLDHGADLHATNNVGQTPAEVYAEDEREEMLEFLINRGAIMPEGVGHNLENGIDENGEEVVEDLE